MPAKEKLQCDKRRIDLRRSGDLEYWSKALGVDATVLRNTVQLVGTSAFAVKAAIKNDFIGGIS